MWQILGHPTYQRLFAAQVVALMGTGLATVALGLLAWEIAGGQAGQVLGTALAIKMIAYVTLAPLAAALAERVPRKAFLIGLDLIRAGVAAALPFVTEPWQIYGLIFLLQAASAGFTPAFQATIPDVLPDEEDYTRALSLSRLAYDLESLLSPMLAAALLSVVSFPALFGGTVMGFVLSALLVLSAVLPARKPTPRRGIWDRTTRGLRIYLTIPRLQGVWLLCLTVSAVGALVLVNTVVIVQGQMGRGPADVALALGAFGAGSMVSALCLPALLRHIPDRSLMLGAGALMVAAGLLGSRIGDFTSLLAIWGLLGLGFGAAQTPIGRVLRRSALPEDLPALFAAQFSLSHFWWLIFYPLAGWLGAHAGMGWTFVLHSTLGALALFAAWRLWPADDQPVPHSHPDLPPDHPHLRDHGGGVHSHPVVIDDLHPRWP